VLTNWMGASGRSNTLINPRFNQPRGPRKALKAAATTRVGMTKGMLVRERNRDLPRKSKRARR
jgi:hypothetical protein